MAYPIVLTERGGTVRRIDRVGTSRVIAERGRWPAWDVVHDAIAVSVVSGRGAGAPPRIDYTPLEGDPRGALHTPRGGSPPLIAPGVPHYALWSPDGEVLSYVAPTPAGLGLFLSRA